MSLTKHQKAHKFGSTKKQNQQLEGLWKVITLQPVLEMVKNELELQSVSKFTSAKPPPLTETRLLENIVVGIIVQKYNLSLSICETRLGGALKILKEPERESFVNLLCRLAYLKTCGFNPEIVDLSNELLKLGFSTLTSANTLDLVDFRTLYEEPYNTSRGNSYSFINSSLQSFLSSVYILHQPTMITIDFIRDYILNKDSEVSEQCSECLQYLFGLATSGITEITTVILPHIIHFICQCVNVNEPIVDSKAALLVLSCLQQAQDVNLYLKVHHELFIRHILTFDLTQIAEYMDGIVWYLIHTTNVRNHWTVYCASNDTGYILADEVKQNGGTVKVIEQPQLVKHQRTRILISDKNIEYLKNVMESIQLQPVSLLPPDASVSTISTSSVDTSLSSPYLCIYGHYNKEELEKCQKFETSMYFNMAKDCLTYSLQLYSHTVMEGQYRKADHIWLMGSKNIRHDYYENVNISPYISVHWVKVKQPDGTPDLELKFKNLSQEMLQSRTVSPETAEIVLLNSHRFSQISVTPPKGGDPLVISFYRNSDKVEERGHIGCDYLVEAHQLTEDVRWKDTKDFDVIKDKLIGRELPLPSKRGTESGDMTATTAAINVMANERKSHLSSYPQNIYQARKSPQGTTTTLSTIRPLGDVEPTVVSEHQIKRLALEAFDRPGQCFFSDGRRFKLGRDYMLPNKMAGSRVLREGGNGVVLEVVFEGQIYAVKQTAFRWREVLIMPKLKHKNILRLCAMLMGEPIPGFSRRRQVYHFYTKMTSDFGRLVGSFEKYCLRTLKEKYRNEVLLLNKIHSNFKYVISELLAGLNYLHTLPNPVVHRDIKPSNVLVSMECDCPNPLACVCRRRPWIVLSDFDASLELDPDCSLQPDPVRNTMQGFYTTSERTYHISPVGTIGFKSPEGFIHMVSNTADVLPLLSTKADIFSFGLVVLLMLINEQGPKSMVQVGVLLLSLNQQRITSGRYKSSLSNLRVRDSDITKILHTRKLQNEFQDQPILVDFVNKTLEIDPQKRLTAYQLLCHPYLKDVPLTLS